MKLTSEFKSLEIDTARLIARAWSDSNFYQQLVNNTSQVLREAGLKIAAIVRVEDAATPGLRLAADGGYEIVLSTPPQLEDGVLYSSQAQTDLAPGYSLCPGAFCS